MATYHLRVKAVSRGRGQNAVAAAAYRSGERLADEATGRVRHYADRAGRVRFAGIFAPFGAPAWARDRATLWNAVERIERRRDATLAREIELSLPHELTDRQRLQLVRDFVREHLVRRGLVVDVAIHAPDRGGDPRNHHAHLLVVERPIGPRGFAAVKDRGLQRKAALYGWRSSWAKLCNRYLAAHGHAARVDHRSLKAQGSRREATRPLGPVAAAMERRGVATPQGKRLRQVQARNALRQAWRDAGEGFGRAPRRGVPLSSAVPDKASSMAVGRVSGRAASPVLRSSPRLPGVVPTAPVAVPAALASLAAVVPERAMVDVVREVCSRGPLTQARELPPAPGSVMSADSGGEVEPCSYEAEAKWIMQRYARQIDSIRQTAMPRWMMEAAIRAVMDAQRAALVAMRERRRWRRQRPVKKFC